MNENSIISKLIDKKYKVQIDDKTHLDNWVLIFFS